MQDDIELNDENWEEQLQQTLVSLPSERAPRQLRRALKRIPREQQASSSWSWFSPGWAAALLLVPLTVLVYVQNERLQRQQSEIAQGQRDLAVALAYLEKTNQRVNLEIQAVIDSGLTRPVTKNTLEALQQPLEITREYEL